MANENQNQQQLKIELPKEELQGRYANMAMIAHGPNDFFIDMILRGPNKDHASRRQPGRHHGLPPAQGPGLTPD